MDLERDEFVIQYDARNLDIADLIAASESVGFPAKAVSEPNESDKPAFYVEALDRARRERKPLVLDFTAAWCPPCQRMLRETFPDPKVAPLLEQCVLVTIDTDQYPGLATEFGVVGLPDIRLLTPEGGEVRRLRDFHGPDAFAAIVDELLATVAPDVDTLVALSDGEANLREVFNHDADHVRLLLILSPT